MKTAVVIGSGFDIDLGLKNSFKDYSNNYYCPSCGLDCWSDFENELRKRVQKWHSSGKNIEDAKSINCFWQVFRKNLSYFFTEKSDEFELNKTKCAYKFLEALSLDSAVFTFNYTNPYQYVPLKQRTPFLYMHGQYNRDTFKKDLMVACQGQGFILGIDSDCISIDGFENQYIKALVKKFQNGYQYIDISSSLNQAEIVIFFGFAMGIVDYPYFGDFFQAILRGKSNCKTIYYITYNFYGFENFQENLKSKIDFQILLDKVSIIPVYTSLGANTDEFQSVLRVI